MCKETEGLDALKGIQAVEQVMKKEREGVPV